MYVYGTHPVLEILRHGRRKCRRLLISRPQKDLLAQRIIKAAYHLKIHVSHSSDRQLDHLCGGKNHQGVILETAPPPTSDLESVLAEGKIGPRTIWLALDGITDPHNLGAILRSAACFGARAVVIPERRTVHVTPVVEKAASGALECIKIIAVVNLNQTILRLKDKGFWACGAAVQGNSLDSVKINGPVLLVVGSEGEGIRHKTREHCDKLVSIPQSPKGVESLNVSCATAVLLYEIRKRLSA